MNLSQDASIPAEALPTLGSNDACVMTNQARFSTRKLMLRSAIVAGGASLIELGQGMRREGFVSTLTAYLVVGGTLSFL